MIIFIYFCLSLSHCLILNFVPVKSIHLSLVEEKDKFFIIDEVSSKVLITFNNEINAQNAMKQITDNLSTTINHI